MIIIIIIIIIKHKSLYAFEYWGENLSHKKML